jgi:hypothetical protein
LESLVVVTSAEPLKLHFNDYKKNEERLASDIPRDDSEVLPTTYKACNLFFLAKELINCIVKTVGIRNNDHVFLNKNKNKLFKENLFSITIIFSLQLLA